MINQLLKTVTFFCVLSSVFSILAKAQIVYTDVNPDSVVTCLLDFCGFGGDNKYNCSNSFDLNLNNDGSNDYKIHFAYSCSAGKKGGSSLEYKTTISPFHNNAVASDGSFPLAMNKGNTISFALDWQVSSTLFDEHVACNTEFGCGGSSFGNWDSSLVKYLGLKLIAEGKTYYGWVRLKVIGGSFTAYDYAYNSIPDSAILAGDTGGIATGIVSFKNQGVFSIYPNPATDKIILSFPAAEIREIQITNSLGQVLFAEDVNSVTEEIDVSQFQKGLFLISVKTAGRDLEGKFMKQ